MAGVDHRSNPTAFGSHLKSEAMETDYDGFSTSFGVWRRIDSPVVISQNVCNNGAYEMSMMDKADFEHPLYSSTYTSWYSSSFEDFNTMKGFCTQQSVNSSVDMISEPRHSGYAVAQSAFSTYIKSEANAVVDSFKNGHFLHKRCFSLLCKIEERRQLTRQMSSLIAPATAANNKPDVQKNVGFQNKSSFEHMVAERNRRVKLRQHFSNLYSFLPRNSKKDKNSILANTLSYLRELKTRVADLEKKNHFLEKSIPTNTSMKEEGSRRFESHAKSFNSESTIVYCSDEVTLEQFKHIQWQVNLRVKVQTNLASCSTDLFVKLLERLKVEQLEVISIQSHTEKLRFHANILVRPKGQAWDISKWKLFGSAVRQSLL